jgi:polysaccharide biosynthesis protein PslF
MTSRPICLISAEYPPAPGGVGDYTACLAAALARAGRSTHVLTSRGPAAANDEPGVEVHRVVRDWGWGCWSAVSGALRAIRPGVAGIQYQTGAYHLRGAINLLPRRVRPPGMAWVTTFHDLREPYLFPKAGPLRRRANEWLMRASDAVIVTNPQDEAALPPWARAKAAGIPIGANIAPDPAAGWDRAATRARYGAPPGVTLIAYFGFFNASKGLDVLLAALALLQADGGAYALLLAGGGVGESDPTNAETAAGLRRQVADLGLDQAVHWTGYVAPADVSAALLSADLAALPFLDGASLRRGSLLAVLAHGLPTITTREAPAPTGGGRWPALRDGENALLTPPGDARALAAAIRRLGADAALRARLAAGARALAAEFDWDRIAAAHIRLYDRLEAAR